ncbi:hypothetical protein GCM10009678_88380 [Actinomadura kijaniata]|uniref:Uncharacterized protein n=1 Tax=Actinomadura namibiensis TaxID=182080 RepID=A0A7W3LKL9_ACTNM|nr:hypothetical protein [Actinomadura namibiensis]MBA8949881.1 hypothetical protein [Actinomadura namibiensis]
MSGAKRITVDEAAWRQAAAAAARLRAVQRDVPALLDNVRRAQRAEADRVFAAIDERQRRLDESLADLSEQARTVERRAARHLREQNDRVRAAHEGLRAGTARALADQERRLRAALAEGEREVAGLRADRERAAATAEQTLADARVEAAAIRDHLPHGRFAPGALDRLEHRLATAERNLASGLGGESLSLLQDTHLDLVELRADLALRDREWQSARLAALHALTVVAERVAFSAHPPAPDENGDPIAGLTYDVDHWSGGDLARLRAEVAARTERVAPADTPLTTDELRAVVRREAPDLERRLDEVVARAGTALLASQARMNVAAFVVGAVQEATGYTWTGNGYAAGDQRGAFLSRLAALNDNEIVVEVAHEEDPNGSPGPLTVRLRSLDHDTVSAEDLTARAREIVAVLRADGLPVGDPVAEPVPPELPRADLDALRERRGSEHRPDAR